MTTRPQLSILAEMARWLRISSYVLGFLIIFVVIVVTVFGIYQYRSAVNEGNATLAEWKKSAWITGKNLDLLTKALVAAEDPSFISEPRLDCGPSGLLKAWRTNNEFVCSPIINHAARLTMSEQYMRTLRRMVAELSFQGYLSGKPDEAIDIILNKTYLGPKQDGSPIEGFELAANFYFGQSLNTLRVSQLALLAGMVRAPGRYSPKVDSKKAKDRRDAVIEQMAKSSFISEPEASTAKGEPL